MVITKQYERILKMYNKTDTKGKPVHTLREIARYYKVSQQWITQILNKFPVEMVKRRPQRGMYKPRIRVVDRKILAMFNEVNEQGQPKYYVWQIAKAFGISSQSIYFILKKFPESDKIRRGK